METLEAEKLSLNFDQQPKQGRPSLVGEQFIVGNPAPQCIFWEAKGSIANTWFSTANVSNHQVVFLVCLVGMLGFH